MSAFDDYLKAAPEASAKPSFDAYVGQPMPASSAPQSTPSPVLPPTIDGQPWKTPSSIGMGVGDAVMGAVQGIVHGIGWAADKVAPNSDFAKEFREGIPQVDATIQAHNAQYSAARQAAGKDGTDWGRLGGNIIGTLPTLAASPEAFGSSLGARLIGGAIQGGAGALMMPAIDPNESFADQKLAQLGTGAALGAAVPAVYDASVGLGRGIWNAAKPVIQPTKFVGQGIAAAMDPGDAAAAASNIRSAPQFVPGSMPTTAQVVQTPFMVQTEKAAANLPPVKTALAQRAVENNTARWQALMSVAQDPQALQAAQAARSAAADPLYSAAHSETTNVGKAFVNFARRPAVKQAMQAADTLAKNEGVSLKWPTPTDPEISGQALDYTKRTLGDMIGSAQRAGNSQQARALAEAQAYLSTWTERYIPAVKQAARTYANMSVPVNTMEAAQQIANSLGTRSMNAGGVPEIQLNGYRAALDKAMRDAQYGIDANAHGVLQDIGQDLQRATISNAIRTPGSDTAYNLSANGWLAKQLYGPTFGGASGLGKTVAALGATLSGHPVAGLGILGGGNKIGQMVGSRLQSRLSDLLLNPDAILPYLDARAAASAQAVPNPLGQRLLQYGRPALVNGLSSSQINSAQ